MNSHRFVETGSEKMAESRVDGWMAISVCACVLRKEDSKGEPTVSLSRPAHVPKLPRAGRPTVPRTHKPTSNAEKQEK